MKIRGKSKKNILSIFLGILIIMLISVSVTAAETESPPQEDTETPSESDSGTATMALEAPVLPGGEGLGLPVSIPDNNIYTGAATYKIPIEVPPGRLGVSPNLSLVYNSSQRNGWIGVGWILDMGSIQRSAKKGVNYSQNKFVASINGSTSELVQRTEWGGTDYYGAKIEGDFAKFKFNSSTGWEVTTKDGTKHYYGSSPDLKHSRQYDPDDSTRVFKWCLDKVEDTNGNYMTISYFKDNDKNEIYLDTIEYTGNNSGLSTSNYVKFYREGRDDVPISFIPKFLVKTQYRLKAIAVFANGNLVRVYKFVYATSTGTDQSLLSSVQQFGSDAIIDTNGNITNEASAHKLPAITFSYTDTGITFTYSSGPSFYVAGSNDNARRDISRVKFGDFNGDGNTDIARVNGYGSTEAMTICLSNGEGSFSCGQTGPSFNIGESSAPAGIASVQFGDFDGDGNTDIAKVNGWDTTEPMTICLSNGNGTFTCSNTGPSFYVGAGSDSALTDVSRVKLGDFNGDGKTDIARVKGWDTTEAMRICLSNGDGTFSCSNTGPSFYVAGSNDNALRDISRVKFGDFDGDGNTDISRVNGYDSTEAMTICLSNGDGSFSCTLSGPSFYIGESSAPAGIASVQLADFNGDGKTDIAKVNGWDTTEPMTICLSVGNNTFSCTNTGPSFYVGAGSDSMLCDVSRVMLGDFNGDGKADIARVNGWGTTERMTICLSSNGRSFPCSNTGPNLWVNSGVDAARTDISRVKLGDFTGDSKTDVSAVGGWGSTAPMNIYSSDHFPADYVSTISNGLGGSYTISYKRSSKYQNNLLPYIVHTVSSITVDDGLGDLSTTNYTYSGGYHHFVEREFRGFQYATKTNPDGTTETTKFYQDMYLKSRPEYVEVKDPSGNFLSKTTYAWNNGNNPPETDPWAFVKLTQKRTDIKEGGITTAYTQEDYTYDDTNGNLLTTITSGTDAESITTANQYQNYGSWLWRLIKTTITGSTSGKIRETYFGYQTGTGNMLYKEFWLNGGTNPRIEFTYDSYGNQKTVEDANNNPPTTTDYDATYTYPVKITYPPTNGITHVIEKSYNYRYGKPEWEKDENGNYTYYTYDPFGRIKQVDYPDGGQTIIEYYDTASPRYTITKVKENPAGQTIDKYGYLDGLGRNVQTITFGEGGKSIVTKTHYDNMGRVDLTEGPYFSAGVGYPKTPPSEYPWVETTYDYRGRPTKVKSPDGTYGTVSTTYTYSGLSTTIKDPDNSKKITKKDFLGRVIEVKEYKTGTTIFTTSYTYNAAGDLLTVTDNAGNQTTITYDTLGRKKTMNDPDMGYWTYQYDPNGNLISQTDAKSQTITFDYDELNRMETKIYSTSDPTVTYTYDKLPDGSPVPNGKGRLCSATNTNVTTTYNSYDKMGRVLSTTKTITGDTTPYTTLNEYDLSGKITRISYPDNYEVYYDYYLGTGLLYKVSGSNGVEYARFTLYEPTGKIGQVNHYNGTATRYTYDNWSTKLLGIATDAHGNPIQTKAYSYSKAGDITSIDDQQTGVTYNYTYDNLHRLLTETNTGTYAPITYTYNAIGNITKKVIGSNTFTYAYAGTHKHAVKKITLNGIAYTYNIDENGNTTKGYDFTDLSNIATQNITYNADNMPVQITHTRYGTTNITYDGGGGRAKKVAPSGTTYYIGEHFEKINGASVKYIFAGDIRIAKVTTSSTYYYHKDHLGSSTVMTDSSGNVVETTNYMPFGEQRVHTGTVVTNYKFTDQELDPETGLYYYGARYYDPVIGRFISADSIVPNFSDPQTLNRYSYCRNNPLIYTDPNGHIFGIDDLLAIAIGAAIGAISSGIQSDWNLEAMATGALIGGVSGGVFSGVEGAVAGAIKSSVTNATLAGAISGAAGGAAAGTVAGGLGAAFYGGNFLENTLIGAGTGAVIGGIMGAINGALRETDGVGGPHSSQRELINVEPNGEQFGNPTGGDMRGCDLQGCGYYGASRDSGGRPHLGIDIESTPGQNVRAPFGGRAYRINSEQYPGVHLVGKNYTGDVLYIKASNPIANAGAKGLIVNKGDIIGTAIDITGRYPGITNHIHFQLRSNDSLLFINPTPFIFPGRR